MYTGSGTRVYNTLILLVQITRKFWNIGSNNRDRSEKLILCEMKRKSIEKKCNVVAYENIGICFVAFVLIEKERVSEREKGRKRKRETFPFKLNVLMLVTKIFDPRGYFPSLHYFFVTSYNLSCPWYDYWLKFLFSTFFRIYLFFCWCLCFLSCFHGVIEIVVSPVTVSVM